MINHTQMILQAWPQLHPVVRVFSIKVESDASELSSSASDKVKLFTEILVILKF